LEPVEVEVELVAGVVVAGQGVELVAAGVPVSSGKLKSCEFTITPTLSEIATL